MKKFNYNGQEFTITRTGNGQYSIESEGISVHTTSSYYFDDCDNDDNEEKMQEAQKMLARQWSNAQ